MCLVVIDIFVTDGAVVNVLSLHLFLLFLLLLLLVPLLLLLLILLLIIIIIIIITNIILVLLEKNCEFHIKTALKYVDTPNVKE